MQIWCYFGISAAKLQKNSKTSKYLSIFFWIWGSQKKAVLLRYETNFVYTAG